MLVVDIIVIVTVHKQLARERVPAKGKSEASNPGLLQITIALTLELPQKVEDGDCLHKVSVFFKGERPPNHEFGWSGISKIKAVEQ